MDDQHQSTSLFRLGKHDQVVAQANLVQTPAFAQPSPSRALLVSQQEQHSGVSMFMDFPSAAETENGFRDQLLRPDKSLESEECDICACSNQGKSPTTDVLLSSLSFRCTLRGSILHQDKPPWLEFSVQTPLGNRDFYLLFKVVTGTQIRKGRKENKKNCFTFHMLPHTSCYVHVFPKSNDRDRECLRWLEPSLGFEDGLEYCVQVFSRTGSENAQIVPRCSEGTLINIKSPRGAVEHVQLTSVPQALLSHTGTKRTRDSLTLMENESFERELELSPEISGEDIPYCEISQVKDVFADVPSVGSPVGVYSFACNSSKQGSKNLRQKASMLELSLFSTGSRGKQLLDLKYIKFKVYADSTIRRGSRDLRRNCFTLRLDQERIAHVMCTSSVDSKKSLKWTIEKKEQFLAFESGMSYTLRVFSQRPQEECTVRLKQNGSLISEWKDVLNPERSLDIPQNEPGVSADSLPDWEMEPRVWNMSLNTNQNFLVTILSHRKRLNSPPRVVVLAKDRRIEVKVEQFDLRNGKSLLIQVPRLFSMEKAQQATAQQIKFSRNVRVLVLDPEDDSELWSCSFTYEVGVQNTNR